MANLPYGQDSAQIFATYKTYARGGAFPLDDSSVFNTKADLDAYINEEGSYAYAGQIVAVANGSIDGETNGSKEYSVYVIRSDKSLQKIGTNKAFDSVESANTFFTTNTGISFEGEVITVLNAQNKYDLYTVGANNVLTKASFDASTDVPTESNGYASVTVDGSPALTADSATASIDLAGSENITLTVQDGKIVFAYDPSTLTSSDGTAVSLASGSKFTITVPTLDDKNNVTGWVNTEYTMPDISGLVSGTNANGNVIYYDSTANEGAGGWVQGTANNAGLATSADLNNLLATNSAMLFKGAIDLAGFASLTGQENGWTYYVTEAGTYGEHECEVGDLLVWDNSNSKWIAVQVNITGAVSGPATSVDGSIALFDGATGKLIKDSGIVLPTDPKFTDTTYNAFDGSVDGLVPVAGAEEGKFLKADGTWAIPENTTYNAFNGSENGLVPAEGASADKFLAGDGSWKSATYDVFDGTKDGLVPSTGAEEGKFLKADGTWAIPENTTYSQFTSTSEGLVPAGGEGSTKFLRQDGTWVVPTDTIYTEFTTTAAGLVPAAGEDGTKYLRADGTWAVPENTTYEPFAGSTPGLVPEATVEDAGKVLAADGSWVTVTTSFTGLSDTNISTPADGDIVKYDAASQKWVNSTLANAGVVSTDEFTSENILAKIKDVDGTGSGLDADTIDGHDSTYFATAENAALTGTPTAPTAAKDTNTTQIATTEFVQTVVTDKLAVADAMTYKGTLTGEASLPGSFTPEANAGDTYKVGTAGYINGVKVEVGDIFICTEDNTIAAISSNYTLIQAKWDVIPNNSDGTVISSETTTVDGDLVVFDGTNGKVIKKLTLTAGKVIVTDAEGHVSASTVDASKLDYIANLTGDVNEALNAKADAENAALTGTPTAPTAANETSSTQIATTEFVHNVVSDSIAVEEADKAIISDSTGKLTASTVTSTELGYLSGVTSNVQTQLNEKAPTESPALTGIPTAPTAVKGTNTTQIASTEFVQTAVTGLVPVVVSENEPADMPVGTIWMDIQA